MRPTTLVLAAAALTTSSSFALAQDDPVHLKLTPDGAMKKVGNYMPQRVTLSADKPASITKLPEGLVPPVYGTPAIKGGHKPAKLFVDSNGNGDLTDDPPAEWNGKAGEPGDDGKAYTMYNGGGTVNLGT